jgi:hypothetical protein
MKVDDDCKIVCKVSAAEFHKNSIFPKLPQTTTTMNPTPVFNAITTVADSINKLNPQSHCDLEKSSTTENYDNGEVKRKDRVVKSSFSLSIFAQKKSAKNKNSKDENSKDENSKDENSKDERSGNSKD